MENPEFSAKLWKSLKRLLQAKDIYKKNIFQVHMYEKTCQLRFFV